VFHPDQRAVAHVPRTGFGTPLWKIVAFKLRLVPELRPPRRPGGREENDRCTMSSDSWALAVDEQEAAESVKRSLTSSRVASIASGCGSLAR